MTVLKLFILQARLKLFKPLLVPFTKYYSPSHFIYVYYKYVAVFISIFQNVPVIICGIVSGKIMIIFDSLWFLKKDDRSVLVAWI